MNIHKIQQKVCQIHEEGCFVRICYPSIIQQENNTANVLIGLQYYYIVIMQES